MAKLEETLKDESLSEQQKQEKRQQHAQKESEFLRLKRSRLGVEDFEPLKVIGRGAFGEVHYGRLFFFLLIFNTFLTLPEEKKKEKSVFTRIVVNNLIQSVPPIDVRRSRTSARSLSESQRLRLNGVIRCRFDRIR